jgi:hypothetical protein
MRKPRRGKVKVLALGMRAAVQVMPDRKYEVGDELVLDRKTGLLRHRQRGRAYVRLRSRMYVVAPSANPPMPIVDFGPIIL